MGFKGEKATRWKLLLYLRAFNAMEEEFRRRQPAPFDPNDPASLRVILLGYAEANLALKAENAQISQALTVSESALATAAPKVEFFDRFANADGHYGLQNAARSIGAPPKGFVHWLKGTYLFYQGREFMPKAAFVKMASFTVRPFLDGDVARAQTFVTPYGLQYHAKKWQRHTMMPEAPRDLFGNAA
jgi:phage antirepressor YoqD-like protein